MNIVVVYIHTHLIVRERKGGRKEVIEEEGQTGKLDTNIYLTIYR